jgi:hypothetical protein
LAGSEFGAEIDDAIEHVLEFSRNLPDLDELGVGHWKREVAMWFETLSDSTVGKELIIKIKPFMRKLNEREAVGNTQGKMKRKDVMKRLAHYGRQVDDREGSVERLRSAYALPHMVLYEGFDAVRYPEKGGGVVRLREVK